MVFLRFCHLEFDKEAISDVFMTHSRILGVEFLVILDSCASMVLVNIIFNVIYIFIYLSLMTFQKF